MRKEPVITENVKRSFLNGMLKLGIPYVETEKEGDLLIPNDSEEVLECDVNVKTIEGIEADAYVTLDIYEGSRALLTVMLCRECRDAKRANEEANRYHEAKGGDFVWGFDEEFYEGGCINVRTAFDFTDEASLCKEIANRMDLWSSEGFLKEIRPILDCFE